MDHSPGIETRLALRRAREAAERGQSVSHADLVLLLLRYDMLEEELTAELKDHLHARRRIERRMDEWRQHRCSS